MQLVPQSPPPRRLVIGLMAGGCGTVDHYLTTQLHSVVSFSSDAEPRGVQALLLFARSFVVQDAP
jgi:hypothetical protein